MVSAVIALPPPPPPTPSLPGGEDAVEESVDAASEGDISDQEAETIGEEEPSPVSSSLQSRVAVLEHRLSVLEQKNTPVWVLFLVAMNLVALGLVLYLLLRQKTPPQYASYTYKGVS